MSEKERGRLFPIRIDGTESVPFLIKKDRVTFGRGDNCDIRVYVDGVESEHCAVLFNRDGEGFLDPLNKCGLTFINGEIIVKEVSLYHNDVITIVKRSFRFRYPSSSSFCVRSYEAAPSFEDNMVQDFIGTDSEKIKQNEICQKRVTFGPTLSPEEFDKNLPPASPIRKGSLPGEKSSTNISLSSKRKLFKDAFADNVVYDTESAEMEIPTSAVLQKLPRLSHISRDCIVDQPNLDLNQSRLLFSEVLKKCPKEPKNDLKVNKIIQKSSSKRLQKKTPILQHSRSLLNKGARHPRILAVGSTGHANSPETIFVCKKKSSIQPDKLQNEEMSKSTSSCSSRNLDEQNGEYSQRSESDLSLPSLHNFCKIDCPSVGGNCIFKNIERNDLACSCVSSNKLSKPEENLDTFYGEENMSDGQRFVNELIASTSLTAAEERGDESNEENNFPQNNAMQQLHSHSNVSPAFNNESFIEMCMTSLKKLALTISMMSAFHMYNKVMEDMSNYSMYFPSTSFDSCNNTCDHRSNSHPNEGQMDIAKLAWFQDMMQNFFSNSVSNKVFEEERCMLRSCRSNLNSDTSSLCHRKMKKSNDVCTVPFKAVDSRCSPSEYKAICPHNAVWRKENNQTADERNMAITNPCYHQDSCKAPILQYHTKASQVSETSLSSPSSTPEYNPNCLVTSSVQNISTNELSECSNVVRKRNVKGNTAPHSYLKKLNNYRNSFSGFSSKRKSMQLIRKSFSPRHFKRGKMSTKTISFINDNTISKDSIYKKLRPRNLVLAKRKQRKCSLSVKNIRMTSSRKFRAKRAKKRESCKSGNDFVKSCKGHSLIDHEQLDQLKIQKVKRRLKDDPIIPKRITRATVNQKNVVASKSTLKITSPFEKISDWEIAKGKNFEEVKMGTNKNVQAMRVNLKRNSVASKKITRTAARKRNVKNVPLDIEAVENSPESTATPIKRKKKKSIKRKEPCKTTSDRSELPKKRVLRLIYDSENSKKRRNINDENNFSIDGRKNQTVKKQQNNKSAASKSEDSECKMLELHCDSGNKRKRIGNDDKTDHINISKKENNKKNSRKVKGNQVEISPAQRITRSMVQKRKRREK